MYFRFNAYHIVHKITNIIRRINLYKRLLFSFLIVIIIPNFIIAYFPFNKLSKETEANTGQYSYQLISNINNNITENLKKYEDICYKIYTDENITRLIKNCEILNNSKKQTHEELSKYKAFKNEINSYLYQTTNNLSFVTNLEIVSNNDEFTQINNNGGKKGAYFKHLLSFRQSDIYRKAIEANGYPVWYDSSKKSDVLLSQIRTYSNNNNYISGYITLLRAIPNPDGGNPLGVIIMNISLNVFSGMYKIEGSLNNGNLLLTSENGVIFSLNENINGPILDKNTQIKILRLRKGILSDKVNGVKCLIAFQDSDYTGWLLVSLIPMEKVLSSIINIKNMIIGISIICIIFAIIISYLVTISISNPLNKLKKTMVMMDEKNIDIEYKDNMNDEIGALGKKFNHMLERIKNLIDTIYEVEARKKKEEIMRKDAELSVLQMQINPHFLYNTLDLIRWEVIFQENGEGKISQMIFALSNLLRLSIKMSNKLVKIQEELDHVDIYIKVFSFRFKGKVNLYKDIDEDIANCKITKLTFQPLIENALVHGLSSVCKENEIVIKAYREIDDIIIQITDNGKGMDEKDVELVNNELKCDEITGKSIGLKNVNKRIKLCFGKQFGLHITSKKQEGTSVIIRIPSIINEEEVITSEYDA